MPSPFPGMDPFLEKNPIFHELHTQMLAEAQRLLQPQLRPKYIAKLERHLSEGGVWDMNGGEITLDRKEPDVTLTASDSSESGSTAVLAQPLASTSEELTPDELELRKQRRIVIYVNTKPRVAVTTIELLSPSNKERGSKGQSRYLEKRSSALHGGLHWVEIDLLRGGERPPLPVPPPHPVDYLTYIAQATEKGWNHFIYGWGLREPIPLFQIPLLGNDEARLDVGQCFRVAYDVAYDVTAADEEANYAGDPPPPPLRQEDQQWIDGLLKKHTLRD